MIGLYGGSFDPVHIGHLRLAEDIREYFNLNKIVFIPTYISPLKSKSNAKPEDRLNMLKLATEYNPFFEIDDREIKENKISYTIKTIMYYKNKLNYNPIF
ncbi:MAG: nicotinate (nicotinamide) nucleotide adenylyltransferase, partial [Persephonella sp.]